MKNERTKEHKQFINEVTSHMRSQDDFYIPLECDDTNCKDKKCDWHYERKHNLKWIGLIFRFILGKKRYHHWICKGGMLKFYHYDWFVCGTCSYKSKNYRR